MECCDFKIIVCSILISAEFCCWSYVVKGLPLLPCTYFPLLCFVTSNYDPHDFISYPLLRKYFKSLIFLKWYMFCEWCFLTNYCALSVFKFRRTYSDYLFLFLSYLKSLCLPLLILRLLPTWSKWDIKFVSVVYVRKVKYYVWMNASIH